MPSTIRRLHISNKPSSLFNCDLWQYELWFRFFNQVFKNLCVCYLMLGKFAPNCDYFIDKMCTCNVSNFPKWCYYCVVVYNAPRWCFVGSISKFFYCCPQFINITNFRFDFCAICVDCVIVKCVFAVSVIIFIRWLCVFTLNCEVIRVILCFSVFDSFVISISGVSWIGWNF